MSKETFYFPHDYEPTSDPKMQALIGKYGGLGYGVFWRLTEMLHSNSDHKLPLKQYIFSAIAKQMLTSDEQMLEIIRYAIDFCELFESDQICFWSKRVDKNFEKRAEISEKRSFAGKLGVAAKANAKQNLANVSKGKERKGKERKEYSLEFESFYSLYPNKKDKPEAYKSWQKGNESRPAIEEILKAVQNQIDWRESANGEFRPEWKNPTTWLNKGSWTDELTAGKNEKKYSYEVN